MAQAPVTVSVRGPQGPVGPPGPPGDAGVDGKTLLSGNGPPGYVVGTDGDFYIDLIANRIYGPRFSGAWGSGTSLIGPAGPAGANGWTVLNGTSAPSNATGANGDFFINTATSIIYGPKAAGVWPAGVSLIGATGATGSTGPQGEQGPAGPTGASGPQGPTGPAGATGPQGPAGAAGSSAYEVAVAGGFVGTESQWLASLVGPQGPTGATGATGPAGATGPQGPQGPQGATGAQGPQGEQGPAGPPGADGADGAAGAPGADGADGRTILNGSGAPSSGTGADGDFYIDTAADAIYGPKAVGAWGSPTPLVGPQGPAGADGADGAAGATGPQGPQGPAGPQGDAGPAGATGPQGPAGATGATGATGPQGPAGVVTATAPITYDAGTQTVAITAATTSAAGSMSAADKTKLDGIAAGAEVNVNADWNASSGDAQILNKPALGTAAAQNVGTAAGNVVQLDGGGKLPAVDGSALTGLPPGTTDLGYTASTRLLTSSTGADVTLPLFDTASSNAGLVPGSSTGGTTNFLRADGTWAAPPGGSPGGSSGQLQFNDGGSFGGDVDLTYDKTTNLLTTKGDISLDDGGSFTTTLQTITPTANRTISLPDATGTVALVAGSSGQFIYNNAGALGGTTSMTWSSTDGTRFTNPFGYGTGAGGTVIQSTNKSTAVTLNARCGQITMNAANLVTNTAVTFTLTNSAIAATDVLIMNHASGGTLGNYSFVAQCAAGSATIAVRNVSAGDLAEAVVISFAVIKATTA